MGATAGGEDADDFRAAVSTGLSRAVVNAMLELEETEIIVRAAIVVDARPAGFDGGGEYAAKGLPEAAKCGVVQVDRASQRVYSGTVQRFIAVDVTNAAQGMLIEQKRFDLSWTLEKRFEFREWDIQRIGADGR